MHLSETNNSPQLARSSAEAALGHQSTELFWRSNSSRWSSGPGVSHNFS